MATGKQRLRYFYPRPPRGGRLGGAKDSTDAVQISIHALREEGDTKPQPQPTAGGQISIHALREEGDGTATTLS